MVIRDPALVHALSIGGRHFDGAGDVLLGRAGRAGWALGGRGGREEGLDPGLVNEVEDAGEGAREEEVQEDAVVSVSHLKGLGRRGVGNIHLGVEEASGRLDNSSHLICSLNLEDLTLIIHDHSRQLDPHILRLHIQCKAERQLLGLTGRHIHSVLHGREVAHNALPQRRILGQGLGADQGSANESDVQRGSVVVGDGDEGLGGAVVDELDAEDVGFGEGRRDVGGEDGAAGAVDGGGASASIL